MVHPKKHYAPDAAKTQVYKSMHCLYRQIYQTTFPLWESAAELSERLKQEARNYDRYCRFGETALYIANDLGQELMQAPPTRCGRGERLSVRKSAGRIPP